MSHMKNGTLYMLGWSHQSSVHLHKYITLYPLVIGYLARTACICLVLSHTQDSRGHTLCKHRHWYTRQLHISNTTRSQECTQCCKRCRKRSFHKICNPLDMSCTHHIIEYLLNYGKSLACRNRLQTLRMCGQSIRNISWAQCHSDRIESHSFHTCRLL